MGHRPEENLPRWAGKSFLAGGHEYTPKRRRPFGAKTISQSKGSRQRGASQDYLDISELVRDAAPGVVGPGRKPRKAKKRKR